MEFIFVFAELDRLGMCLSDVESDLAIDSKNSESTGCFRAYHYRW